MNMKFFHLKLHTDKDEKILCESEAVHPVSHNFVNFQNKIVAFLQDKY